MANADKPILLAWEIGSNLGHAMALARIASALAGEGRKTVACLHSLASGAVAFGQTGVPVLQSPLWPPNRYSGLLAGAGNYADILTLTGFHRPQSLSAVVNGWLALISLVKPAVAVADHSPAFLVAARIRNLPVISIGVPSLMPPLEGPTFPMFDTLASPLADEQRHLDSAAAVLAMHGNKAPKTLPALFATEGRFVLGLPEIDPYFVNRRAPLYAPLDPLPARSAPARETKLFVYLGANEPHCGTIVRAIAALGVKTEFYFRDQDAQLSHYLERRGHLVHSSPPSLAMILPQCSHVISAGGAHTTQAAMAAGRPHMIFPLHEEAAMNARLASRLGVATTLDRNMGQEALAARLGSWINDTGLHLQCAKVAATIAGRESKPAHDLILSALRRHFS